MDLTTVYWIFCVAFVIAILVMITGLVAIVVDAYESIQRIVIARRSRN